jgi:mono/diheme cytochrome c family protein
LYRGQWGISKDDYGRLMYNHNSTWLQADLFAAEDLVGAGGGGYPPGLGVNLTEDSQVYSVRVNPGVNRAYLEGTLREDGRLHRATGVSGLAVYRGDQFPEQYRGDVFVPEAAGNVVAQFAISEHGMDLGAEQRLYIDEKWGQRDFLGSTDERFRPVDAMNGPDGALYVIDMYRGIIQDDHFLTDELREQIFQRQLDRPIGKGRIWRVRHTDGRRDRAVPVLAGASGAQLVAALGHINGWVRDTAQRLLLASGDELRPALENLATADDTLSAIHAIWTLEGREELSRELVLQVAQMNDPGRQVQALRAGRLLLSLEDMETLYASLGDGDEAVRMQLAFSMGEHNEDAAIRDLLRQLLVAGADSPYISQAVLKAVSSREMLFLQELLASTLLTENTTRNGEMLAALTAGAYRSLRGNLGSTEPANPALQDLLALVESRAGDSAWQQIAMLEGLQQLVLVDNFQPAMLESPPPIFTDGSISEGDPLWDARLGGRRAFTWPGDELALGLTPLSPEQLQLMAQGEALYPKCAACHGNSGAGTPGLAPPLAGASWVTGPPEWLGRIILQGMTGPVDVNGESWDGVMPPHGHLGELDDATLAGLMTYMRRSWGNKANPVSTEAVAAIREASAGRGKPWTAGELEAVPFDRGYTRFLGKYGISFVTMTIKEEPDGLHMSVPMYGGGLLTPITETLFQGSAGSENVKVEFVVEENGSVNRFILHREGEKLTVKRKSG